jgi:UDPglucose 6-dehydrogenase
LLVGHQSFTSLDPSRLSRLVRRRFVLDARNILDGPAWQMQGFEVQLLGSGTKAELTR